MGKPLEWNTLDQAAIWLSEKTNEKWTDIRLIDFAITQCRPDDIVEDIKYPTYLRAIIPDSLTDPLKSVAIWVDRTSAPIYICESVCINVRKIPTICLFKDNLVELKANQRSTILFVSSYNDLHNKLNPEKDNKNSPLAEEVQKPVIIYCELFSYIYFLDGPLREFPLLPPIQINSELIGVRDEELKQLLRDYLNLPKQVENKDRKLRPDQRDKIEVQKIAKRLWEEDPTLTIADVISHPETSSYKKKYRGKDTLRNWVRPLDPRIGEKRGRPPKRKN